MVKSYLRYEQAAAFGVIASGDSNITYDSSGKHLLAPALEKVGVWHVRQGVCTKTLTPSTATSGKSISVTSIASSPTSLVKLRFLVLTLFFFFFSCNLLQLTKGCFRNFYCLLIVEHWIIGFNEFNLYILGGKIALCLC